MIATRRSLFNSDFKIIPGIRSKDGIGPYPSIGSSSKGLSGFLAGAHRCPSGMELTCMDRISWICTAYVPFGTPKCIFSSFQLFWSPTCCEVGRVDLEEGVPKCKGDPGSCQTENIVPKNCWLTWNLKIPLGEGETFPNHQFFVSMFFLSGVELVFFPTHFDVWDIFRNQKLFCWESPKNILRVAMIAWKKSLGWKKHTPRKASTTKKSNTSWNPFWETSRFFGKQVSGLSSISKNLSIFNHF